MTQDSGASPERRQQPFGRSEAPAGDVARWSAVASLLPGLVHEVRNPLAVVQGYAQLLHQRLHEGVDRDDSAQVLREAQRIDRLLGDLVAWIRADDGVPESLEVRPLVESAQRLSAYELRHAGLCADVVIDDPSLRVLGRRGPCLRALVALFVAARNGSVGAVGGQERVSLSVRPDAEGTRRVLFVLRRGADAGGASVVASPTALPRGGHGTWLTAAVSQASGVLLASGPDSPSGNGWILALPRAD